MLPSLLNTYIQLYSLWWDKLWPITLYFTGAYLREYKPRLSAARLGLLLCAVLLGFAGFDVVLFKGNGALANTIDYAHYQNYFISLLTFAFMLKLPVDKISPAVGRGFAKISELSFAIYLLSSVSDGAIYPRFAQLVPEYTDRYIWLPVLVGMSFGIALVLAWLSSFVYEPMIKLIKGFFEKRIKA